MSRSMTGIWLMVLTVLTFAVQDGFSRLQPVGVRRTSTVPSVR